MPDLRRRRRGAGWWRLVAVLSALTGAVAAPPPAAAEPPLTAPVEIVFDDPADAAANELVVNVHGGDVLDRAPGVLLARIPVAARTAVARQVRGFVRAPLAVDVRPQSMPPALEFGATSGSEVSITRADAWHAAGIDGTGITIGVIDFFDVDLYWNEAEHGPRPVAGTTARCYYLASNCTDELFDGVDLGGEYHGVAVVEILRDMAPGARILVGQAATIGDYYDLIDWFAANGATMISRSLGGRYDGPGDGRGSFNAVVDYAVSRGMLWVNSAGNSGSDRYYRQPVRLVGNRVAFGPSGSSTFLRFRGLVEIGGFRWANDWDVPAAQRTDYDFYLWESPTGSPGTGRIIAGATDDQRLGAPPLEYFSGGYAPHSGYSLYLEAVWRGGDITGDVLEILDYGSGIADYAQAAYSAAIPGVDARHPGAVSVGAVDPPANGRIAYYSSQGPTNDGRIVPSLSAPSGFASTVIDEGSPGTFQGTSASAPTVTGAAALLSSIGLASDPTALGDLLRNSVVDRGAAGPDNAYGTGELRLPKPPTATTVDDAPSRFVAAVPQRVLDTRPTSPIGPSVLTGRLWRGEILELPVAGVGTVPAGATAVAVNITTVAPDRPSYVQALPTRRAAIGAYSNLNVDTVGQTRANFAIVPVGERGSISIYSIAEGHVVVDLLGWFVPTSGPVAAGRFVELPAAQRLLDSRRDAPAGPLTSFVTRRVPMPTGVPAGQVAALVVTVTATASSQPGWVQIHPADRPGVIGRTSTVNVAPGTTVANTAIVPIGTSGAAVTGYFAGGGSSHAVVDAIGYITSQAAATSDAGRYRPVRPARAFDSRRSGGPLRDRQSLVIDASSAAGVSVPDTASAVLWNMAIVEAARAGYLRAWAAGAPEPPTSSLNWVRPGEIRAAAVIAAVDRGRTRVRVDDGSANQPGALGHVLADVFGYFT